jgi:hypothetical protein
MPAGPIGSSWATDSWPDTAWEANSWADLGSGTASPGRSAQSRGRNRFRLWWLLIFLQDWWT